MTKTLTFEEMEQVSGGKISMLRRLQLEKDVRNAKRMKMTLVVTIERYSRNSEEEAFIVWLWERIF